MAAELRLSEQAICAMTMPLGLPVTVEHILRPILLQLSAGPHIALALLGLASTLGPTTTSQHLLPPLLSVLCCPYQLAEDSPAGGFCSADAWGS